MLTLEKQYPGIVCGIDEAGRAPVAGPVTAGCVFIRLESRNKRFWSRVNDSKKVPAPLREELYDAIKEHSCYGIGQAWQSEIDRINIHHATLLAMKRAFEAMCENFDITPKNALVDGKFGPALSCNTVTVIGGDGLSRSIAAASILAKVTRDRYMRQLHEEFPHYGWNTNVGYPTKAHLEAIRLYGITIHHRKSFQPIRQDSLRGL